MAIQWVKTLVGVGLAAVILTAALVGSSVHTLEVHEYGLDFNSINQQVDEAVYGAGRHYLGVGHSFLVYPSTLQHFEFSNAEGADRPPVTMTASLGSAVQLEISFQYVFQKDNLFQLYNKYPTLEKFSKTLADTAQTAISDNSRFENSDFYTSRLHIRTVLTEAVSRKVSEVCYVDLKFFQLRDVNFIGSNFERTLNDKLIAAQKTRTADAETQADLVRAQSAVIEAEGQARIDVALARDRAEGFLLESNLRAQASQLVAEREALSYKRFKDSLGFSSQEMVKLAWIRTIGRIANSTQTVMGINANYPSVRTV